MRKWTALFFLVPAMALAEGTVTTGEIIGPSPSDFAHRFNGISSSYAPGFFPRIRTSQNQRVENKNLGNGITLTLTKIDTNDAFKEITVRCSSMTNDRRILACTSGIVSTVMSIDTSINERDFLEVFEEAIEQGSSTHNQSGVDYKITVNRRNKSISMVAKPDGPARVEKLDADLEAAGLTDTLQVVPCNPAIHRCR